MTRVSRILGENGQFDRRSAREMEGARVAGFVVWDRYHIFCHLVEANLDTKKEIMAIVTQRS